MQGVVGCRRVTGRLQEFRARASHQVVQRKKWEQSALAPGDPWWRGPWMQMKWVQSSLQRSLSLTQREFRATDEAFPCWQCVIQSGILGTSLRVRTYDSFSAILISPSPSLPLTRLLSSRAASPFVRGPLAILHSSRALTPSFLCFSFASAIARRTGATIHAIVKYRQSLAKSSVSNPGYPERGLHARSAAKSS